MKVINCLFFLTVFVLLSSACSQISKENTSPSQTAGVGKGNVNISANKPEENKNTIEKKPNVDDRTDIDKDEPSDFSGTIKNTDKNNKIKSTAILKEVRTGKHANYDRTVFEFEGEELPGYYIEYIDKPVRACGSGNVVELKGEGWLEIRFTPAQSHTNEGQPTVKTKEQNPNYKILKQLKSTCDFEGNVTWVLGVSTPNEYRIIELKNPTRLALDVKH